MSGFCAKRRLGPRPSPEYLICDAACLVVLSLCLSVATAHARPVSSKAATIIASIDALEVEHHWPAGVHVHWKSGTPDGKPETSAGKHMHCSAFVAAAAKRFGIYLLPPPEHAQTLLANAQYDWLMNEGAKQGCQPVRGDLQAQAAANNGMLVVATYKNHNKDTPAHIAIVRPSDKSDAAVRNEGPQVTQAGGSNYRSTSLQHGFAGHPAAWGKHEVRYYAHAISISK